MTDNTIEFILKLAASQFKREARGVNDEYRKSVRGIQAESHKLRGAFANLEVRPVREINREIQRLQASYARLRRSGSTDVRDLARAKQQLIRHTRELRSEIRGADSATGSLGNTLSTLRNAAVFGVLVAGVNSLRRSAVSASDTYAELEGRLRLVTESEQELRTVEQSLFDSAQRTRSNYEGTVELYARVARNADNLGLSQRDLLTLTEATNQAIQISGAGAQEAAAGVIQFAQALASGELRGDEFRSVMENMPRLAAAIADELDVTIGQLRDLAAEGELSASVVSNALINQADVLAEEYSQLPKTVGQAMTQLANEVQRAFAQSDTSGLIDSVDELRNVLTDPALARALTDIATGVIQLSAASAGVASTALLALAASGRTIGNTAGEISTSISGTSDELLELENDIERLQDRLATASLIKYPSKLFFSSFFDASSLLNRGGEEELQSLLERRRELLRDRNFVANDDGVTRNEQRLKLENDLARSINQLKNEQQRLDDALAEKQIDNRKEVLKETISASRKAITQKQREINQLIAEETRGKEDIEQLLQSIADKRLDLAGIQRTAEERIRDLRRQGLSDSERQADIEAEIVEKTLAAREALKAGDLDTVSSLTSRLDNLAGGTGNTEQEIALIQEIARIRQEAVKQEIAAEEQQLQKARAASAARRQDIAQQQQELATAKAGADELRETLKLLDEEDPTIQIRDNIDEITARVRTLKAELADLNQQGTVSGVLRQGFASVPGFARGGHLPGYGGGDRIPAVLESGEYVIRKEAVRRYGPSLFAALNAMRLSGFKTGGLIQNLQIPQLPQRYQEGGAVSPAVSGTVRIELGIGRDDFTLFGEQDQVDGLVAALSEVQRGG